MLSYRHAFHAGNHADVLKHLVLVAIARYMGQKLAPVTYIDTHAGAGLYALDAAFASKNQEFESGIGRLWAQKKLPEALSDYVEMVRHLNPDGKLRVYPGSPWFANQLLREQDRLWLYELHPGDAPLLSESIGAVGKRVKVEQSNGFAAVKALLPPPSRRALVMIDPPYEDKSDYRTVLQTLQEGLQRLATGVFVVWYPQLQRRESQEFPQKLKKVSGNRWLHVTMTVRKPGADGFGMHGSGMMVVNPPWTLRNVLDEIGPVLIQHMGEDEGARFHIEESVA